MNTTPASIGIVGARGHVGAELIRLVAAHPGFELAFVSSRALDGQPVAAHNPGYAGALHYSSPGYDELPGLGAHAVVLALPNGKAARCVEAFDRAGSDALLIDLSADYRFDPRWYYGLPELTRDGYVGQRRISNPGCYATAMQLAVTPMLDAVEGPVQCFGVSGHSGAGTTPSDRNDPDKLRDNLMPYALTGHVHEREVSSRLGHPVEFMPHVAPHFRGIIITANLHLARSFTREEVLARYGGSAPSPVATTSRSVVSRCRTMAGGSSWSPPRTTCSRALRPRRCRTSTSPSACPSSPASRIDPPSTL